MFSYFSLSIQPSVLTEKQRIERFKASFHKNSLFPPLPPLPSLSGGSSSQEGGEREESGCSAPAAPQPGVRVSVIKTNKRSQPEQETCPLLRLLLDYSCGRNYLVSFSAGTTVLQKRNPNYYGNMLTKNSGKKRRKLWKKLIVGSEKVSSWV